MAEHQCERQCVDCGGCIDDRPQGAYLCKSDFESRQRAARRASYRKWREQNPTAKSRARLNGTVGKEVVCSCGQPFVKRSGNHKFCDACATANRDFYRAAWNSKHPDRAHGPALNGRWGAERTAVAA